MPTQKSKHPVPSYQLSRGFTGKEGLRGGHGLLFLAQCRRNALAGIRLSRDPPSSNRNNPPWTGAGRKHLPPSPDTVLAEGKGGFPRFKRSGLYPVGHNVKPRPGIWSVMFP